MSAFRFDPLSEAAITPREELFPATLKAWFSGHSGIQPLGPDPDRFDEICHEHVPAYGLRRADIELHTLVPEETTERARERSSCMS